MLLVERDALLVFWVDVRRDGSFAPAVGARVVADAVRQRGSLRMVVAAALTGVPGLEIALD